jgi:hypothetical protein
MLLQQVWALQLGGANSVWGSTGMVWETLGFYCPFYVSLVALTQGTTTNLLGQAHCVNQLGVRPH